MTSIQESSKKNKKRSRILKAARTIFFKKGFEKATVEDIAENAQVAKGTVYLYFSSKEEICRALSIEAFDIFCHLFQKQIESGKTALEKILVLGKMFYELYREQPEHFKIMQDCELLLTNKENKTKTEHELIAHKTKIKEVIEQLIREGQKEKSVRDDLDPAKTALIVIKVTRLYILTSTKIENQLLGKENTSKEEMIEHLFFFIRSALENRDHLSKQSLS